MTMHTQTGSPKPRGLWIAFFGLDGVGKSSTIEQAEKQLGAEFSGVVPFHFRPMFRSRGVDRPPVSDPHGRTPHGVLLSIGKLLYWLADCWYGYLIAILPAVRGSELVIFDRYLSDVLVDPLRYRLSGSSVKVAKWLLNLAPRPDLCILLDAPAEVVHTRKHELSLRESKRLRIAYLRMFASQARHHIVNADRPIEEVVGSVNNVIARALARHLSQEPEASLIAEL